MRIGLGVSVLARGRAGEGIAGIGSYTWHLGNELVRRGLAEVRPVSFRWPVETGLVGEVPGIQVPSRYHGGALRSALLPVRTPGARAIERRVDLFHAPDHMVPRLRRVPVVATVHDAILLAHPEWYDPRFRRLRRWLWRQTTRWADRIVTVSEYARAQIAYHFDVAPACITVVPNGVDDRFFARFSAESREAIRAEHGLPPHFFLTVGTLQPRKNMERVLAAHARLPRSLRTDCPLVVVGRQGWQCGRLVERLQAAEERGEAYWLPGLPDRELRALMQAAEALVFPSLAEGFGLPVLEAFASGLPVITSSTTALPEVAGDAALLVDPHCHEAIAGAMTQVLESPELQGQLRARGRERARRFSWARCAEETLAVYTELVG